MNNKIDRKKEQELANWMIDNYVGWRLGDLGDERYEMLQKVSPNWEHEYARQILSAVISKIMYEKFQFEIENDINAPWDKVVETIQNEIRSCFRFGTGAVVN